MSGNRGRNPQKKSLQRFFPSPSCSCAGNGFQRRKRADPSHVFRDAKGCFQSYENIYACSFSKEPGKARARSIQGEPVRISGNLREYKSLKELEKQQFKYEILFLDASDEVLVKRFKEKRRSHPLSGGGRVITGIELERNKLREVKDKSDIIIDTSKYKIGDLREEMTKYFGDEKIPEKQMSITVLSFGFKYGIPVDSDLVFDVRFIPNPFYIPELKPFSGLDAPVRDYVLGQDETKEFLGKLTDMLEFLIPNYKKEGKRQLIIAIGCTGGRHRSVAIANEIYQNLHEKNYDVYIEHRDIKEDVHKGDKKL